MTVGSLGERPARAFALRVLRAAALIVVVLLAVRVVTAPRPIVWVASTPITVSEPTTLGSPQIAAADEAVEARQIRRVRQLHPSLLPQLAVLVGLALLAAATQTRRHDERTARPFASLGVPVLGGRAPPLVAH